VLRAVVLERRTQPRSGRLPTTEVTHMPLSPEDVVEKRFNPTRVREGYAQDEVDDFLDEVVAELRRLTGENTELRSQLDQCQARVT